MPLELRLGLEPFFTNLAVFTVPLSFFYISLLGLFLRKESGLFPAILRFDDRLGGFVSEGYPTIRRRKGALHSLNCHVRNQNER